MVKTLPRCSALQPALQPTPVQWLTLPPLHTPAWGRKSAPPAARVLPLAGAATSTGWGLWWQNCWVGPLSFNQAFPLPPPSCGGIWQMMWWWREIYTCIICTSKYMLYTRAVYCPHMFSSTTKSRQSQCFNICGRNAFEIKDLLLLNKPLALWHQVVNFCWGSSVRWFPRSWCNTCWP